MLFAMHNQIHMGWMVFEQQPGGVSADVASGPYKTREEAEKALGLPLPLLLDDGLTSP